MNTHTLSNTQWKPYQECWTVSNHQKVSTIKKQIKIADKNENQIKSFPRERSHLPGMAYTLSSTAKITSYKCVCVLN